MNCGNQRNVCFGYGEYFKALAASEPTCLPVRLPFLGAFYTQPISICPVFSERGKMQNMIQILKGPG